jgi:hypothetical protein
MLEMAHMWIDAALETSGKWPPVTDMSLLRCVGLGPDMTKQVIKYFPTT